MLAAAFEQTRLARLPPQECQHPAGKILESCIPSSFAGTCAVYDYVFLEQLWEWALNSAYFVSLVMESSLNERFGRINAQIVLPGFIPACKQKPKRIRFSSMAVGLFGIFQHQQAGAGRGWYTKTQRSKRLKIVQTVSD
jgi:hypothetical protein